MQINEIFNSNENPTHDPEIIGPCYIVAEIGTSHQGDRVKARNLIQAAAEAGADCVKSQYVIANEILHPNTGKVHLPTGEIPLYDVFLSLEQDIGFYQTMAEDCKKAGVNFLCSPFGIKSARNLKKIGMEAYKIASPELNHFPLLKEVASYTKPVILSTGVSLLKDIEAALSLFQNIPVALLHCITAYPAPAEQYNLRLVGLLSKIFGLPCGISDHSLDPLLVPCTGLLEGSRIIEKHFTLGKDTGGLDDPIALDQASFHSMVKTLQNLQSLGRTEASKNLYQFFSEEIIEQVRGTGHKTLAESEKANYSRTNRSIHALKTIKAGEILTESNIAILRTEKILSVGSDPALYPFFLGKTACKDIGDGEGMSLNHIIPERLD